MTTIDLDTLPTPVAEAIVEAAATFAQKNADYAQDSSWRSNFDSIASQMGSDAGTACDYLIAVKQARLQSLTVNGRDPTNESLYDTILDRMVYSIIAVALAKDEAKRRTDCDHTKWIPRTDRRDSMADMPAP